MGFGRDGRAYVYTDLDAQRGRICVVDPLDLRVEARQDLIRERTNSVLEGYAILDGDELERPIMLVSWTTHAVAEVTIHDLATGEQIGELELPGIGTIGGMSGHPDGGHEAWFIYTDHATIPRVMKFDALTGDLTVCRISTRLRRCATNLGNHEGLPQQDGTEVRLMLLEPIEFDGRPPPAPLPAVLYGYGGLGVDGTFVLAVDSFLGRSRRCLRDCLSAGWKRRRGEWWHRDGCSPERTSWVTSSPARNGSSTIGGRLPTSWLSVAVQTVGCWWVPS